MVLFSHEIDDRIEEKQKQAVVKLKKLTRDIRRFCTHQLEDTREPSGGPGEVIARFHKRMNNCHHYVLWKSPARYLEVANDMHRALLDFYQGLDRDRQSHLQIAQAELLGRASFYQSKLRALRASADHTAAELGMQRELLQGLIALDVSRHQEYNRQKDKKESDRTAAMQTQIALLGIFFLPASLIAGIFSTTFFDFRDDTTILSANFWIYWVVTIPLTIAILGVWLASKFPKKDSEPKEGKGSRGRAKKRAKRGRYGRYHVRTPDIESQTSRLSIISESI